MHEIILCKLGEVVLKGLNRHSFEMKLMSNIRRRTQRFGKWKIYSRQSTIYVEPAADVVHELVLKGFAVEALQNHLAQLQQKDLVVVHRGFPPVSKISRHIIIQHFSRKQKPPFAQRETFQKSGCLRGQDLLSSRQEPNKNWRESI